MTTRPTDVSFEGVHHTYPSGVEAVRGVDLHVPAGQRLAVVGRNGAGKTTLVRHLNGIFRPTRGTVRVGGRSTEGLDIATLSRDVGYVFQNPDEQLFARTVGADVAFGPRNLGLTGDDAEAAVAEALEQVGLAHRADHHPYTLSLSERKLVALASVLAMRTPVVVLDEPTTGQDERGVRTVARIVEELAAQGRTVVAVTHDMDFCAETFERVVVMAQGQVQADGTPRETFRAAAALETARVEPPQLLRLADALGWGTSPLTVDELVHDLTSTGRTA